ncbi:hypothetical protein [Tenuibacillus multivorans]|uniref:Uncharacterized protein n=1 Tax=Tenuibacillus multivorans TaxID=237069 RepID=A0A1G9WIU6_9BACI|nr:hypothetical protein [Tenuibacillus multivorans]GEL76478.1 hypothetical protein TMU01_07130 [Tenuibacillus multivorans]SDM84287.1 hypothetical protein SAMN05216498_0765 [Tenuibacillus multivorans]
MDKKAKWEQIQAKGKKNYVMKYGVLGWGLSTGILYFFILNLLTYGMTFSSYFSEGWLLDFLIGIVIFMFAGVPFGLITWKMNNRNYQKLSE